MKYNTYLQKLLREVDNKIVSYIDMHGDISPETILDIIDGNDKVLRQDQGIEFLDFAKQRFIDRYNSGLIGVSSRENGISYSLLINGMKKKGIELDRKVLAEIAVNDPKAFTAICESAK